MVAAVITQALATATARQLEDELRAKRLSSRELLDTYLARIDQLDQPINAVVTLDRERAYAAAARADDAATRGEWLGPLHGLPITIKDAIEVAGVRSTGGATELAEHVPAQDAPSVGRLRSAGAIVFGKTNVPRWSGDVQTFNSLFGTTNNPWSVDRVPGGSSGGPAAAVACGFTAFELGTDIGGSIRVPAHCCGIFGLKPSYGVISQRGYLDHVGGGHTDADINVFGPLARSAEDLELLLSVLAGPDSDRALAWRLELPEPRHVGASDFRVGIWLDDAACPVDRDELAVIQQSVDRLADAGARVEEAHPPVSFAEQVELFNHLVGAATSLHRPDDARDNPGGSHRAWLRADDRRAHLRGIWREWFERYDALICPVMATPAFPHNQEGTFDSRTVEINGTTRPYLDLVSWTGLIGVLGLPSAVPPIGRTSAGLPVGVQVVTAFLRDREAIQLARIMAEVSGSGYQVPPGF
jgi:amidase